MTGEEARSIGRRSRYRIAFLAFAAAAGALLADGYIGRLPYHAGFHLVAVDDAVRAPLGVRPRHAVLIVVDGLRRDAAETMSSTRALAKEGQCRVSDQGSWTVSRPVYALLSTGIEVDRSGARNNDLTSPLAAESIWQVARSSGLRVAGSSHLPWFAQLFPDGFDRFDTAVKHEANVFDQGDLVDLNLYHPLYVDDAGHHHGAASPEYAAAVARADREILALVARLDLTRDLVVLTADHGHRAEGGHGGAQAEIKDVLACFAGLNVARRVDRAPFDGRGTGPAIALLEGLRFPRQMRAGEDGLDALWDIAQFDPADAAYLADRQGAVARFREANRVALEGWLGGKPGTWSRLYARGATDQGSRRALVAVLVALVFALHLGRRWRRGAPIGALATTSWLVASVLALWGAHRLFLGPFDFTVINLRVEFVPRAFAAAAASLLASLVVHRAVVRRPDRAAGDFTLLVGLALLVDLGHVFVYGWPLGFPLPSAAARYFPFFGGFVVLVFGIGSALVVAIDARRARRAAGRATGGVRPVTLAS